jgi:hypothetical protein
VRHPPAAACEELGVCALLVRERLKPGGVVRRRAGLRCAGERLGRSRGAAVAQERDQDRDRHEHHRRRGAGEDGRAPHAPGARSRTTSAAGLMSCSRATDSPA